jgi:hypothetical protein
VNNSGLENLANSVNDGELRGPRRIRARIHSIKELVRERRIAIRWVPADVMSCTRFDATTSRLNDFL